MTFIETPPHLILQPTRLSPLQELPPVESVDDYASTDDLLRDARDYTAVLDFNVNIPAEHANAEQRGRRPEIESIFEHVCDATRKGLLIPPGESSPGGASSVELCPGEHYRRHRRHLLRRTQCQRAIRQRQHPLRRPLRYHHKQLRIAPHARRHGANLRLRERARQVYADKHSVALPAWRTFQAKYTAQRSLARSLHQRRDAGHCSPPRECVALRRVRLRLHRLRRKPFRGGNKLKVPNTFKEAMRLPKRHDGRRRQTKRSPS